MFDKLSATYSVMGSSWAVLRKDKEVIFFSLLSGLYLSVLILGWGAWVIHAFPEGPDRLKGNPLYYGWEPYAYFFLFYLGVQMVSIFFNAAIVACTARRLSGQDPTVSSRFTDAFKHFPSLFIWAFISACFVTLLDLIRSRKGLGRWIAGAMRIAASVATFFVLPVIIVESANPVQAIGRSMELVKKTWGEQVLGNFSFALLFFFINIPGIFMILFGLFSPSEAARWTGLGAGGLYLAVSVSIGNSLSEIFRTVLYFYVRDEKAPEGFDESILCSAFGPAS